MKFRKKPVTVEAFQLTPKYLKELTGQSNSTAITNHIGVSIGKIIFFPDHAEIQTLEGMMRADLWDWIITGIKGEQYPCKPDIFNKTYEPVDA